MIELVNALVFNYLIAVCFSFAILLCKFWTLILMEFVPTVPLRFARHSLICVVECSYTHVRIHEKQLALLNREVLFDYHSRYKYKNFATVGGPRVRALIFRKRILFIQDMSMPFWDGWEFYYSSAVKAVFFTLCVLDYITGHFVYQEVLHVFGI